YVASFPVMYNVQGRPTYACALKDKTGLIKLVALVSVENFGVIGIGETPRLAMRAYKSALNQSFDSGDLEGQAPREQLQGVVERIGSDVQSGQTYYYLILEGTKRIFVASSRIAETLVLTQVGDRVIVQFDDAQARFADISEFQNLTLGSDGDEIP
ncbi:MAG: hypothetical protein MI717_06345, partial [Spirochaetales bacterium]|nr:hypothetical protein [Spirochaetales bacterium]